MAETSRSPGIWSAAFTQLFLINFIVAVAQFTTITVVPKLAVTLGASSVIVGVVTGMFAVTALAVRPAVGPATVRIQHRLLLLGIIAIMVIAFLLYALSKDVAVLMAARLLHGAGMGFLAPVTLALASDALPERRMAAGIGVFSLGQALATAVGPPLGLILHEHFGYTWAFLIGAGIIGVAFALALRIPRSTLAAPAPGKSTGWRSFIAIEAVLPAVVIFFLAGAYSGVNTFIVLFGESQGVAQIGFFFTAYAVCLVISRPVAGRIADKFGLSSIIIPGIVIFGVSFIIIANATTLTGFVIAGAVSAFGYGICQPAIQTLALTSVEPGRRGVAGNTNYMGVDLGYLAMPMLSGWVVAQGVNGGASMAQAYAGLYRFLIIPVAIGLVIYVAFGHNRRTQGPKPPALPEELA